MRKLHPNRPTSNEYVVTLHPDVVAVIDLLTKRAKAQGLVHLTNIDPILNGALFEHLKGIDKQIRESNQKEHEAYILGVLKKLRSET